MTRIVGHRNRSEFVLDPAGALRQGRVEGLLKTKTDHRDKDRIDREALGRLRKKL